MSLTTSRPEPSGNHTGSDAPSARLDTLCASPPAIGSSQTCAPPSRVEMNARVWVVEVATGRTRLAVRARPIRHLPRSSRRDLDDPDPRDVAIILERGRRNGVGDPLPVRRELRIADGLERDVIVEGDGALLGEYGKREKGNGKRECKEKSQSHLNTRDV